MIDLPTKAEVHCSDGPAGRSTYVIFNPKNHQMTHLVVQSNRPPFRRTPRASRAGDETTLT